MTKVIRKDINNKKRESYFKLFLLTKNEKTQPFDMLYKISK